MTRVAVVGVNNIGKIHCATYSKLQGVELVAVCDLVRERADQVAQLYHAKAYDDVERLLASEEVDIVSVATSGEEGGSQHFAPTMVAIRAGVDVLVEKPLSNRLDEAKEMVESAAKKGVRLACNLNHRFTPAAHRARELILQGQLGALLFANMRLTIRNGREQGPWTHMRALHTHSIDVLRFFAGDIRRVQAFMTKAPGRSTWSTASVNLEFASGAVGHLTGSWDMSMKHPIEFCEVAGDKGRIVVENAYESMTFYPHDSDETTAFRNPIFGGIGQFNDTFQVRLGRFVEQVREKADPDEIEGSGKEALAALAVVEAAIESHRRNGAVVDVTSL